MSPRLQTEYRTRANWVDVVAGARIQVPLSSKALVTVLGDAGAGGANSDYQVAGLIGYKFKEKFVLQGGWRYLAVNYRPSDKAGFIYDMAMNGPIIGVTINFK